MSGSKDQQTGWLKELKKGDKVQLFKTNKVGFFIIFKYTKK